MYDAIGFQQAYLGRELWKRQRQMCRAVDRQGKRIHRTTSVKGCHGSGKTYAASGLVPYKLLESKESIVLTIAPTLRQVKTFWNEVHAALDAMHVKLPEPTTTSLRLSGENYALGFSSSKGVNAQGFHGKKVLIIKDEAVGIVPDLNDAIEGIRSAGDVTVLELCNPTVPHGTPYENHTRLRGSTNCITISAFDTPNLAGLTLESLLELPEEELDYAPMPWLTRRRWVKEMYYKWGPTNPRFLSRVLGEFPTQSDWAVFELLWIERAQREPSEAEILRAKGKPMQVGIDVGGPGDDETTATARVEGIVIARAAWSQANSIPLVMRWLNELQRKEQHRLEAVVVDTFGIGADLGMALSAAQFPVYGFNGGHPPVDRSRFLNVKAEAYWHLRGLYRRDLISHRDGTVDEDTQAQFSTIEYREVGRGLIQIETKDEARKRGVNSPDRAEAEIMAFYQIVHIEGHVLGERKVISRF